MTVHLPTLKQLQYLVTLRDQGHFGRAAAACNVSQSTLSAGIRELETALDLTLLERNRRTMRFTAPGEAITAKARDVLREAAELGELATAAGRPLTGPLRMSVIPTIAPFILPRLLPRVRIDYPALELFLREETSAAACERLAQGGTDCVLLALPFACGEVEQLALFTDSLVVAYPASQSPTVAPVRPETLDDVPLLLLEDGHCLKDHVLAACPRPQSGLEPAMLGTSLHTIVQMVDNALGVTLLPDMAVRAGILHGTTVETRGLASPAAHRTIALVWRRGSPRARDFAILGNLLKSAR